MKRVHTVNVLRTRMCVIQICSLLTFSGVTHQANTVSDYEMLVQVCKDVHKEGVLYSLCVVYIPYTLNVSSYVSTPRKQTGAPVLPEAGVCCGDEDNQLPQ